MTDGALRIFRFFAGHGNNPTDFLRGKPRWSAATLFIREGIDDELLQLLYVTILFSSAHGLANPDPTSTPKADGFYSQIELLGYTPIRRLIGCRQDDLSSSNLLLRALFSTNYPLK